MTLGDDIARTHKIFPKGGDKMHLKKFLIASLAAGSLIFTPEIYGLPTNTAIVHAEIKEYVGVGESIISDRETLEIGKQGAKLQAIRNAQEKAGVFIGSYSVVKNSELDTDEVVAFTAGVVKINENVKYEPIMLNDDLGTFKYRATVVVTIDTDDLNRQIDAWRNRNSRDRSNIVEQNKDLQNLVDQQAKRIKELEQTIAASKDKEQVRAEISRIENETQIIEKTSEGNLAYYNGDYSTAAEKYSDVLKLKEFESKGMGAGKAKDRNKPDIYKQQARRAATMQAQYELYKHLCDYVESRKPTSSEDEQLQSLINTAVKNSEITKDVFSDDGVYEIKMRLRPEDVDKLKAYLER